MWEPEIDRKFCYEKGDKVGQGSHGVVCLARVLRCPFVEAPTDPQSSSVTTTSSPAAHSSSATTTLVKKRKAAELGETSVDANDGSENGDDESKGSSLENVKRAREQSGSSSTSSASSSSVSLLSVSEAKHNPAGTTAFRSHRRVFPPVGTVVAIKKIHLRDVTVGLNMEAIREMKLLQELHHPHVLHVYDVYSQDTNIHVVMEYLNTDLDQIISNKRISLSAGDVKQIMRMLLLGVEYIHSRFIVHRDIKPQNLLIGTDGLLKLADFGLAKLYGSPLRRMSPQACTLWYRAPELLGGNERYSWPADMWSVGCVFAELLAGAPMFPANNELDLVNRMCRKLGTPTLSSWPSLPLLRNHEVFSLESTPGTPFEHMFPHSPPDAVALLKEMLVLCPEKRVSAASALQHAYFTGGPRAGAGAGVGAGGQSSSSSSSLASSSSSSSSSGSTWVSPTKPENLPGIRMNVEKMEEFAKSFSSSSLLSSSSGT